VTGGFTTFIMRYTAAYRAKGDVNALRGLVAFGFMWVIIGTVFVKVAANIAEDIFDLQILDIYKPYAYIIVGMGGLLLCGAILRGHKNVVLGRLNEFAVQPFLFLLLCLMIYIGGNQASVQDVFGFYLLSIMVAAIIAFVVCYKYCLKDILKTEPIFEIKKWVKSAAPLIFVIGLVVANTNIDIVMVGAIAGEVEAGQYRVASRMAGFVLFVFFAVNNTISPRISGLYADNKKSELQSLITKMSRICLGLTVPIAAILFLFAAPILSLSFGEVYVTAALCLMILVCSNLFNVAMGQVGQVLSLTGHEIYMVISVIIALAVNVSLNYILVPIYGIEGAAIATASSIIIWNGLMAYFSVKKTGLYCTALGAPKKLSANR